MSNLNKDILIGILFLTGLVGFISGEFIISSTLFLVAAIASNINLNRKGDKASQLSWD
jgi:CheY-specific phosphatase CheX